MSNLSELITSILEKLGVRCAYGIPGGSIQPLFHKLRKSKLIKTHIVHHESNAGFAAIGSWYSMREKNQVPLIYSTSGPGITNAITGITTACYENIPLIFITSNVSENYRGLGAIQDSFSQDIDCVSMLKSITCQSLLYRDYMNIYDVLYDLYQYAIQNNKPVHINFPTNILSKKIDEGFDLEKFKNRDKPIDLHKISSTNLKIKHINQYIELFLESEKPLLFIGNAIKNLGLAPKIIKLSKKYKIPIINTSHSKGVMNDECEFYIGNYGFASNDYSSNFINNYNPDSILLLGTSLSDFGTNFNEQFYNAKNLIYVNNNKSHFNRFFTNTTNLYYDLTKFIDLIENAKTSINNNFNRDKYLNKLIKKETKIDYLSNISDLKKYKAVHPALLFSKLSEYLITNANKKYFIAPDIGNSLAWVINKLPHCKNLDYYIPIGLGCMGSGIGIAVGYAMTVKEQTTTICITGDCAFNMSGIEILSAIENNANFKLIILNDRGHGMVDHGSKILNQHSEVRFRNRISYKKLADSMNADSAEIINNGQMLDYNFDNFTQSKKPYILDIHIDETVNAPIGNRILGLKLNQKN